MKLTQGKTGHRNLDKQHQKTLHDWNTVEVYDE